MGVALSCRFGGSPQSGERFWRSCRKTWGARGRCGSMRLRVRFVHGWLLLRYFLGAYCFRLHGDHVRWRRWSAIPFFVIFVSSWWRIAEPRFVVALPNGALPDSRVSLVTSAVFHHEDTKGTKKRRCGHAADEHHRTEDESQGPTGNTIRAKNNHQW